MASNNYHPSGSGKRPNHRLRIAQCVLVVVLLAVLFLVITMLSSGSKKPVSSDPQSSLSPEEEQLEHGKFKNGTTVNGVDIGKMTAAEAREALSASIESQKSAFSVTLTHEDKQWVFDASSAEISSDLEAVLLRAMEAEDAAAYTTALTADASAIEAFVTNIATEVDQKPVDATMEYDASNSPPFRYVDGQNGYEVDVAAVSAELTNRLGTVSSGTVSLVTSVTEPSVTVESLKTSTGRIAHFSTTFSTKDKNRTANLDLACEKLNGYVIKPGATFSFNDVVGPRDEAHGWKEAHVIVNGSRYEDGWGGGICQVSTTLYNALLLTGSDFSNFSRKNHSIPSSYVAKGLDATVSYGSKDFKFTNSGDAPIYILASTSGTDTKEGTLTISLYGKPLPEGMSVKVYSEVLEELAPPEPELIVDVTEPSSYKVTVQKAITGYKVAAYREITIDGETKKEQLYTDTYKPVQGIYTVGGADSSSSSSSGDSGDSGSVDIPEEEIDIPEE